MLPAETDPVPEEKRGKKDPGRLRSSSNSKIVFRLLIKVISVHMGLSAIYVQGTGLQLLLGYL